MKREIADMRGNRRSAFEEGGPEEIGQGKEKNGEAEWEQQDLHGGSVAEFRGRGKCELSLRDLV